MDKDEGKAKKLFLEESGANSDLWAYEYLLKEICHAWGDNSIVADKTANGKKKELKFRFIPNEVYWVWRKHYLL